MFPKALHRFAFPPAVYESFTILPVLIMVCLFNLAILVGVKWYLITILICISLMTYDIGYVSVCACLCELTVHLYIFGEMSVQILCPFQVSSFSLGYLSFLLLSCRSFKYSYLSFYY